MNIVHYGGLAKTRAALMLAGLCWLSGFVPPVWMRLTLAVMVVAVLLFDGWIDDQKISRHTVDAKTGAEYRPAA